MARPLPKGIKKTSTGFRTFVRVRTGHRQSELRTKRWKPSATIEEMRAWREAQRVAARSHRGPKPKRGTLAADIEIYLSQVKAMPTYAWRQRDLYAWREAFGEMDRHNLNAAMIRAQLQAWRTEGPVLRYIPKKKLIREIRKPLSASACNHRRTALLHLYSTLDPEGPNPVRAVKPFREPAPQPRAKDLGFLEAAVARIRSEKLRAVAAVLLWTGIRGRSELGRMTAAHVDLERRECYVPTGKGGAHVRTVPLNAAGVAAWESLLAVKEWNTYDKNALLDSVQRAVKAEAKARGIPAPPVRVYDLRHSIATSLLRAGADLADVQDVLGHTSPRMTRRYAPFSRHKVDAALRALEDKKLPEKSPENAGAAEKPVFHVEH